MANQWAIAIGINTYRAFQSLQYAQHDAEALCRHLIDSGITAPENCLLLTTASALHRGHSTFPERETIARWLKGLVTGGMGSEDSLILFFSGYGVHANGEDYLMPVDGDPAQAAATGIAIKSIYRLLAQVPSGRVLVALDMNRNAGSLGEPAGAFTARVAQQTSQQFPGIATLLSCKPPEQFARESAGVRHGFFTAGILEVLHARQRDQPGEMLDLKTFGEQLTRRMAELCEHYWRPVQTPVVIGHYQIPLGRAVVGSFVDADTVGQPEDWHPENGSSGQEAQFGEQVPERGAPVLQETLRSPGSGNSEADGYSDGDGLGSGSNGSSSDGSIPPILTPLDISRPADISSGFGDDFAGTWAWSQDDERHNENGGNSNGGNSNGTIAEPDAPTGRDRELEASEGLDPYALAWEEDFGDTIPFDANSDLVLNAQALLEQQADNHQANHQHQTNHQPAVNQQTGAQATEPAGELEPANGGRSGHGGDGTDWHWADLSLAAATEDSSQEGLNDSLDSNNDSIFDYRDRPASSPGSPNGFPEPGPLGGINDGITNGGPNGGGPNGGGQNGASLVVAPPLNPTQTILEAEDPNWNWNGESTAIDVETHSPGHQESGNYGSGNYGSGNYGSGNYGSGNYGSNDHSPNENLDQGEHIGYGGPAPETPVDLDWPDSAFDLDDEDSGGIPIIELDSEELISTPPVEEAVESNRRSEGLPAWLSLRVLGVLGLASIIAWGWLGFFRGERADDASPKLQSRFNLPGGLGLPDFRPNQADDELGASDPTSDLANNSARDPVENELSDTVQSSRSASNPTDSSKPDESLGDSAGSNNLLDGAQQRIEVGQASSLNRAIDAARKIPPSDPNYEQARQSMNQWSQQVLALSQQRAQEGKYLEAIATARLVPSDLTGFNEARQSISQWQIPAQLEHAKAVIRPSQASSYNRAIGIARNVPAGTPTYSQAQELMQGWANEIFAIAQQRARQEQWGLAIAAAKLVPPDMLAYDAAQRAIADWQPQINKS